MINKVSTGIEDFDLQYGGVFENRPTLVCGAKGTGKTTFGLNFLNAGLKNDERCLLLSTTNSKDLVILGESLGMPVNASVDANKLFLLEYNTFVPGRDADEDIMLPPDGFLQLQNLIEDQVIERVVIDSVLPWVAIKEYNRLAEHIFSFVRAFERVNVSCLFTIPKPVSTPAIKLKRLLQQNLPVCLTLKMDKDNGKHYLNVDKYIGAEVKSELIDFDLGFGGQTVDKKSKKKIEDELSDEVKYEEIKPSYFENLDFEDIKSGDRFKKKRSNSRTSKDTLDDINFVDSFEIGSNLRKGKKKSDADLETLEDNPVSDEGSDDLADDMLKAREEIDVEGNFENGVVPSDIDDDGGAEKIDFSSFIFGESKVEESKNKG
jgi:KaiC/GvpD/RAD55 family RecA-like ATPase